MPDIQLLCGERAALVLVKNLVAFYPNRLCSVHMKSLPCIQSFDFDKSGLASARFRLATKRFDRRPKQAPIMYHANCQRCLLLYPTSTRVLARRKGGA